MAPNKKKDKSKGLEWLQCSLCKRLISPQDADILSTCCTADHSFIQDQVLHGRVVNAEGMLGEDGDAITKSVRDKESAVWLAIQTMQVCGLSIGQPCVVNNVKVKRSWPHKSLPLSSVALSEASRKELQLEKDGAVTVKRFVPQDGVVVDSAILRLREDNPLFETQEFSSFIAGYLDGKFITEGSPLLIRYFGQTCHCAVESMTYLTKTRPSGAVTPHTPLKQSPADLDFSSSSTPASHRSELSSVGVAYTPSPTVGDKLCDNLTDSMASLNMSDVASPVTALTSTPQRVKYPNLVTPVKGEIGTCDSVSPSPVFARVSARDTVFTVRGSSLKDGADSESSRKKNRQVSLSDVGGLEGQIDELRSRIQRALQPSCLSRCLLLQGPPGTGKSLLVKAVTSDLGLPTTTLAGTDVWSRLFGEAESNLRKIFKSAQERAPSIIVIDDIDVICPKRSQNSSGQEHRIVGTVQSLVDDLQSNSKNGPVVVIGVTNNRDGIDPALRRAGRFASEIELGVPTVPNRAKILQVLLRDVPHTLSEDDINTLAGNTHGYVGADLAALVNEASMKAVTRAESTSGDQQSSAPLVTLEDMVAAGVHIKPSALREIQLEVPQVRWSDIGGMAEVKMRLREAVELPLSHPEVFTNLGIEPPRGLLMYGPPGCSKTMIARALATECRLNFLAVKGPELFNQYVGESEKAIREVFRKARAAAPSVVFFDEIDAIAAKRGSSSGGSGVDDRVLTQLLTEMDGLEFLKDVFIMAATNRPDKIDNALLRPGRFDSLVYVPLPDSDTRGEILRNKFTKMAVSGDVELSSLVKHTDGYSGAEVVQVCQEAALYALREDISAHTVGQRHFDAALEKVKPQVNHELIDVYNKFSHVAMK